jgi:hypothetical protein
MAELKYRKDKKVKLLNWVDGPVGRLTGQNETGWFVQLDEGPLVHVTDPDNELGEPDADIPVTPEAKFETHND